MKREKSYAERLMLYGVIFQFALGALLHFVYEWTGQNVFVGTFAPINESIWEHTKLVLLPTVLWYTLIYFLKKDKIDIDRNKWFLSSFVAFLTGFIAVPTIYYLYTGALGFESIAVDVLILLLAFISGYLAAKHFYRYSDGVSLAFSVTGFIIAYAVFILFTFYQPDLPIFISKV